jgi:hypothetical protein
VDAFDSLAVTLSATGCSWGGNGATCEEECASDCEELHCR